MTLTALLTMLPLLTAAPAGSPAEQKKAEDQYIECIMYTEAPDEIKDLDKAFKLCLSAAKAGIRDAQFNLGVKYVIGAGTPVSIPDAIKWYKAAAAQSHTMAASNAADLLIKRGEKGDYEAAIEVLEPILWQKDPGDLVHMGAAVNALAKTEAEKQKARGFWLQAVDGLKSDLEKGKKLAAFNLGVLYHRDLKNPEEAAKYYRMGSDQGHSLSSTNLGFLYHEGLGVPVDEALMLKYYQRGAEQGDHVAHAFLGELYYGGEHPKVAPQDYSKALHHLSAAADLDNPKALTLLSEMYRDGKGVKKDPAKAKALLDRRSELQKKPS